MFDGKKTSNSVLLNITKRHQRVLESRSMVRMDSQVYKITRSKWFNGFMYILVVLNSIEIGFGLDHDPDLTLPIDGDSRSETSGPVISAIENISCAVFTIEIVMRMLTYKRVDFFFKDPSYRGWNILDLFVVVVMIIDTWIITYTQYDESLAIRMLRITRMFRLSRIFILSDDLRILFRAILASLKSILISGVPLMLTNYLFAVMMTDWCNTPGDIWESNYQNYFGTVLASMLTLWQISQFDDWYALIRPILTDAPFWGSLLVLYMFLSSFMILNVLLGVISQIVLTSSSSLKQEFIQSEIEEIYEKLDEQGHGSILVTDLLETHSDRLRKLGVKIDLVPALFKIVDPDSTGRVTREAFVSFMMKVVKDPESQDIIVALKTAEAVRGLLIRKKLTIARQILKSNPSNADDLGTLGTILLREKPIFQSNANSHNS
jgi:hypothetical protein